MSEEDGGYGWEGDLLDLPAYLERVGYDGDLAPTVATLRALHRAHVTSIPFENLEIMLGRPVGLELDAVQDKLVRRARGGYCFEHNRLFAAVLERLGFDVTALVGRVMMGAARLRPGTHALIHVRTSDQAPDAPALLCDVGFGFGPLEPLELAERGEIVQDGWAYRLRHGRTSGTGLQGWELHQRNPGGWVLRHMFTLNEAFRIDYDVANYYVSTNARSPFTTRPFAQKFRAGSFHVLDGTDLTLTLPSGEVEKRSLAPEEVPERLAEDFGIVLDGEDVPRLIEVLHRA
jgi:N-hydroxyarylamine O-acetyltransferase